jgi:septum formation protein
LVVRLARQKGTDVAAQLRREPSKGAGATHIVACDTVCQCGGQVLGKPVDRQHAQHMLSMLSGRSHSVLSGLCVWPLGDSQPRSRVAETTLRMDPLSPEQIEEYLDSGLWEGKAGAFGYQDRAGWLHVVAGSESNVIGLPLELLGEMLENREK